MIKNLISYKKNKIVIILLSMLYVISVLFCSFYHFERQDIQVKISTDQAEQAKHLLVAGSSDERIAVDKVEKDGVRFRFAAEDIHVGDKSTWYFQEPSERIVIKSVAIYRNGFKVRSIAAESILGELQESKNIGAIYQENSTIVIADILEGAEVTLGENLTMAAYNATSSLSNERILADGLLTVVYLGICGVLLVCTYRKNKDYFVSQISSFDGDMNYFERFWRDIYKYGYYMVYSARTDLKAEVANSYLNWFWWILEPFFNMMVYVIVFGKFMGASIDNFAVFIFSGILMWNFFSKTINYSVKLVRNNRDIISKVYIPKFVILLSNMFLNLFKLFCSIAVLAVLMVVFRISINGNILWLIPIYLTMFMMSFGLGMIFLHFGVFIDDLSYAVTILLNMLMFLSGVFYDVSTTLPEPLNRIMVYINPVAMLLKEMRGALMYKEAPDLLLLGGWFLISVILCCLGVRLVYKNENGYVKVV